MKQQPGQLGFSLIELLIAISVFSIVMLALSGIIVQGLQLRKGNEIGTRAQAYATAVLEQFKSFWSEAEEYNDFDVSNQATWPSLPVDTAVQALFSGGTLQIDIACIDLDGSEIAPATCIAPFVPPLRRVSVLLRAADGTTYANFITEIGNPIP